MKYFWTLFWTFLLVQMLYYVAGSMTGAVYDLKLGALLSVGVTILILLISTIIPNESNGSGEAH